MGATKPQMKTRLICTTGTKTMLMPKVIKLQEPNTKSHYTSFSRCKSKK